MEEDKTLEITSTLEEMSELMQRLMGFSRDLMQQFSETGFLTVETKKDFDNLIFECENCIKKAESIMDSNEKPM